MPAENDPAPGGLNIREAGGGLRGFCGPASNEAIIPAIQNRPSCILHDGLLIKSRLFSSFSDGASEPQFSGNVESAEVKQFERRVRHNGWISIRPIVVVEDA